MKVIHTTGSLSEPNNHIPGLRVRVYWNDEWEEYICKTQILLGPYANQRWLPFGTSKAWNHTDDLDDAVATANAMLNEAYRNMQKMNPTYREKHYG